MISATWNASSREKETKTKHGHRHDRYLIRCLRVLQTERHASCEFTAQATQRPKHGFEALSSEFAKFGLARAFLLRLLGGICGEDTIVTLHTISLIDET